MEGLINLFHSQMPSQAIFGWFHLLFIALLIASCVLAVIFAKKHSVKTMRIVLIVASSVMILLEIYKQITYTFSVDASGVIVSDYQWYAFPFQLCSTPMYVMLIAGLCKPGKFQKSLVAYLALFSLFGGLTVYAYPNQVLGSLIGINLQTMIHHGLQIVIACYLLSFYRHELNNKFYLKSLPVFGVLLVLAMVMNLIAPTFTTESFNMFYISPYFPCILPILSALYPIMPYGLFLTMYILGFCLVAYIIFAIAYGFNKIVLKRENKATTIESPKVTTPQTTENPKE